MQSTTPFSFGIVARKRIMLAVFGIVCVLGLASQLASRVPPPIIKRPLLTNMEVTGTLAIPGMSQSIAMNHGHAPCGDPPSRVDRLRTVRPPAAIIRAVGPVPFMGNHQCDALMRLNDSGSSATT